ncbi:MAG: dipeptidyl aminopeptidase/acylaminoacyl peptidase [Polaribacter sp.]|jgi:dipeptidyl aminopeptidase/acylaminoacyl peptidase
MQRSMKLSPSNYADKIQIPILLAHGEEDQMVEVKQSQEFHKALKKTKASVTYTEIAGAGHNMNKNDERLHL